MRSCPCPYERIYLFWEIEYSKSSQSWVVNAIFTDCKKGKFLCFYYIPNK
jgi:hypothetical protein